VVRGEIDRSANRCFKAAIDIEAGDGFKVVLWSKSEVANVLDTGGNNYAVGTTGQPGLG
jgi:hypothetical protein